MAANPWQPVVAEDAPPLLDRDFENALSDHYLINPIVRASPLMAELSANAKARRRSPALVG